jgi:hypothetical protein
MDPKMFESIDWAIEVPAVKADKVEGTCNES